MNNKLDKIEQKLDTIDNKLDEVRINTAVIHSRVEKLEKDAGDNKKLAWTAITSGAIAVATTLFKFFATGGNGSV